MIRRIWAAYQVEVIKALRARMTYAGPVLVVLLVLLMPRIEPIVRDGHGDYAFIAGATLRALNLLGLVLILLFVAPHVAAEAQSGSVRTLLVRPVLRSDYLAAKLLLGWSYAVTLLVLIAASSWGIVAVRGDLTGVTYGGEMLHTNREMLNAYLLGMLVALLPLLATVAYAVMVSALAPHAGAAVGAAVGLWLLVDLVKHPLGIDAYVFTRYFETPWRVFADRALSMDTAWWPLVRGCVISSAASAVLFMAVALYAFRGRNLRV